MATREKNPENEAMIKALEEPVTMPVPKETPLDGMLKYIKDATAKPGRPRCRSTSIPWDLRMRT